MSDTHLPIDTISRRKVRLFRQKAAAAGKSVDQAFADKAIHHEISQYWLKGKVGRRRAELKIKRRLPVVHWHEATNRILLGAYLTAMDRVIIETRDPGQEQWAVCVNYVIVTDTDFFHGLWTLEIPEHALGRIAQRDPTADMEAVIWAAHKEALAVGMDEIERGRVFYLATPPNGAFLCEFIVGPDMSSRNSLSSYIRPRTWVHRDQMWGDQQPLRHGKPSLGHTFLLPMPAKEVVMDGKHLMVRSKPLGL